MLANRAASVQCAIHLLHSFCLFLDSGFLFVVLDPLAFPDRAQSGSAEMAGSQAQDGTQHPMAEGEQLEQGAGVKAESPDLKGLMLDFDFGPSWARKPPGQQEQKRSLHDAAETRAPDRRTTGGRGGRPPPRMPDRRRDRELPRRESLGRPQRPAEPAERLPLSIGFLPEQKQLAVLVRQLRASKRAYPLVNLTALFSSKPEFCSVKMECRRDDPEFSLYQCKTCRAVARDRLALAEHAVKRHLSECFDVEETEGELPTGQFVCVARCGLSGILLGPPNHHSYGDKLQEVYRTRYAGMSLEAYRAKVEMCRDPELIERWRQEACKRTLYRLKNAPEENRAPMTWTAAEAHFLNHIAPPLALKTSRAILSVSQALESDDRSLRLFVQEAWQREVRSPRSLLFALRAAIRNRRLCLFRIDGNGREFVSALEPAPLKTAHVVAAIRDITELVQKQKGCRRPDLLAHLAPGKAPDSPEAGALLSHVSWLVEKGHLIEFFDGTFMVCAPHTRVVPAGPESSALDAAAPGGDPQDEAAPLS